MIIFQNKYEFSRIIIGLAFDAVRVVINKKNIFGSTYLNYVCFTGFFAVFCGVMYDTVVCIFNSCNFDAKVGNGKRFTDFEGDFAIIWIEFVVLYFIFLEQLCVILEKLHFYTSCLQIYVNQTLQIYIAENPSKRLPF